MRLRARLISGLILGMSVTLALVILLGGGPWLLHQVAHRSDPDAFQSYVATNVGHWHSRRDPGGARRDKDWFATHPDAVMAEGRAACAWLHVREDAPSVDPTGASTIAQMTSWYLGDRGTSDVPVVSAVDRRTIVAGAWRYLCWWDQHAKTAPARDEDEGGPD